MFAFVSIERTVCPRAIFSFTSDESSAGVEMMDIGLIGDVH